MKQYPLNWVTESTFPLYWQAAQRLRRQAQAKQIYARIGDFLGSLVFLTGMFLAIQILICDQLSDTWLTFLHRIPGFTPLFSALTGSFASRSALEQFLLAGLAAYDAAWIGILAVMLLVWLVYHPRSEPIPQGPFPENAALLAAQVRQARSICRKPWKFSLLPALLFTLALTILVLSYGQFLGSFQSIFSRLGQYFTGIAFLDVLIAIFAVFSLSSLACWLVLLLPHWVYSAAQSYRSAAEAEAAAILSLEVPAAHFDESWIHACLGLGPEFREHAEGALRDEDIFKARALYLKGAYCADVPSMERYAGICLRTGMKEAGRFWLKCAVDSGKASPEAKALWRRVSLGLPHGLPAMDDHRSSAHRTRQKTLRILTLLKLVLLALILVLFAMITVVLIKTRLDFSAFGSLADMLRILFQ